MKLKIGDPVICYKPIWMDNEWRSGIISNIIYNNGQCNEGVYFYLIKMCGFSYNIFPHNESILIGTITLREDKLKELGIYEK